ncbi:DUF4870 domain-containing protein [Salinibius halmophilus]|uniref:DUF4870 domain-containing protein n=1 Tax=Salinibius halmophilus TaxID=1853216 RepID=UPI000E668D2A|nr:DUF4870 domain-containing protein [Salinibius halmophilus]
MSQQIRPWGMDMNAYLVLMHLSQFAGFVIPLGGFIVPIIMWIANKNDFPEIDQHGKNIVNWIISATIYSIISVILMVVLIGFLTLAIVGLLGVIFAIIGALKANQGEYWSYPLSIKLIK